MIKGEWKYIEPHGGPKVIERVGAETGNSPEPPLYHLRKDLGETNNVAAANPQVVKEMDALLNSVREQGKAGEDNDSYSSV